MEWIRFDCYFTLVYIHLHFGDGDISLLLSFHRGDFGARGVPVHIAHVRLAETVAVDAVREIFLFKSC